MSENGSTIRLRQAVLVASELEPVVGALKAELGLAEPFQDPGVGEFGLVNAVFALGDCFLEVIAPKQPDTAAGRYLDRQGGDGGYMVIFDLEELDAARARAGQAGIRVVWQIDLPDISGTHLHPADMRGAIVSIDQSRPYGSWRWGGPDWTAQVGEGAPGRLAGVTLAVADPAAAADRWGHVLGVPVDTDDGQPALQLDGATVGFTGAEDERAEGLTEIAVEVPPDVRGGRDDVEIGGARFVLANSGYA